MTSEPRRLHDGGAFFVVACGATASSPPLARLNYMHAVREGAFLGWLLGSWFAFYCAFHAPLHYARGADGIERVTSLLIATMPVAIALGIALVALARHQHWEMRQLSANAQRKVTRIALALNATVVIFWTWYAT